MDDFVPLQPPEQTVAQKPISGTFTEIELQQCFEAQDCTSTTLGVHVCAEVSRLPLFPPDVVLLPTSVLTNSNNSNNSIPTTSHNSIPTNNFSPGTNNNTANTLRKISPDDSNPAPVMTVELWQHGPVLLYAIRRPSCFLCRHAASLLMKHAQQIKEMGVRMVAVCKEFYGIDSFRSVWTEEIYVDIDLAIFKYLWDGNLVRDNYFFLKRKFYKNAYNAREHFPRLGKYGQTTDLTTGEGFILGGICIITKDSEVIYTFKEETAGNTPEINDILDACKSQVPANEDFKLMLRFVE